MKNNSFEHKDRHDEILGKLNLSGFDLILHDVDKFIRPKFYELVILVAIGEIAQKNGFSVREQLHIWRPFDV
tara:strand:- start:379 stop:594 length:216 start_codon:yes stop_codon:yes gene_type:complete